VYENWRSTLSKYIYLVHFTFGKHLIMQLTEIRCWFRPPFASTTRKPFEGGNAEKYNVDHQYKLVTYVVYSYWWSKVDLKWLNFVYLIQKLVTSISTIYLIVPSSYWCKVPIASQIFCNALSLTAWWKGKIMMNAMSIYLCRGKE
jgi:hypothetical protein